MDSLLTLSAAHLITLDDQEFAKIQGTFPRRMSHLLKSWKYESDRLLFYFKNTNPESAFPKHCFRLKENGKLDYPKTLKLAEPFLKPKEIFKLCCATSYIKNLSGILLKMTPQEIIEVQEEHPLYYVMAVQTYGSDGLNALPNPGYKFEAIYQSLPKGWINAALWIFNCLEDNDDKAQVLANIWFKAYNFQDQSPKYGRFLWTMVEVMLNTKNYRIPDDVLQYYSVLELKPYPQKCRVPEIAQVVFGEP
ncbi:hypothetical protein L596_026981 [Steinernema carpocapsae]|uniref:Uncharacterized protein n=1 Tax=Steinernema carpocapsae TaxID=34508 RepID=A0A4U5M2Y6_STECR|nr:hypothetical protein L596_026981 [Steinernema carpocapsae]